MKLNSVYIETTTRCNLNCVTCYNASGKNRVHTDMDADKVMHIINAFRPYGLKRVQISGGEPTLNPHFGEILDLADSMPELTFSFVTNGTVHNGRFIEMLNTRPNMTVQISLDGSNEEINARTRGAGHFAAAADFARRVNTPAEKPRMKEVISRANYGDVEDYYRLAHSLGCMPEFAFIFRSGNGAQGWEDKSLTAGEKLAAMKKIEALNAETGLTAALPRTTVTCTYVKGTEGLSLCVKPDGTVQPCQVMYDGRYSVGNVFTDSAEYVEENINRVHAMAKERACADLAGCGRCIMKSHCGRGCMALAVDLHGDYLAEDEECEYRKMLFLNELKQKQG